MDRPSASKARQQILRTEKARASHVKEVLQAGIMIDGSFVTLGRKCGKACCRCATGEKHFSKYVSRSVEGRTKLTYVPASDEVEVATRTERYRCLREARAALMNLAQQSATFIDELQEALTESYPPLSCKKPQATKSAHNKAPSSAQ